MFVTPLTRTFVSTALCFVLTAQFVWAWPPPGTNAPSTNPRPAELRDILAWKRAQSQALSPNGEWLAYQVVPAEGDSEVVVRHLTDGKEQRFPIGEVAGAGGFGFFGGRDPQFSDDSKWLAFSVYATVKEGKALKKQRKPAQKKVHLLELGTAKKTEFEKVRSFAFNGERGGWLALHRYGTEGGPSMPAPAAAGSGDGPTPLSRPQGADLLLVELGTEQQLNFGNVSEFAFNKKGTRLAMVIDAADQAGNGVQMRDMETGAVLPLESQKAWYKGLNWTEEGDGLAILRGKEDKAFEDKLYAAVGWSFRTGAPVKAAFDPKDDSAFPKGFSISPNRNTYWLEDLSALVFGIHEPKKKKNVEPAESAKGDAKPADSKTAEAKPREEKPSEEKPVDSKPPAAADKKPVTAAAAPKPDPDAEVPELVMWHWQDKRLPSMQQVQEGMDKNFSYLSLYRVAEKKFVRLADDTLRSVSLSPRMKAAYGVDVRDYERMANLNGQRFQDLYSVNLATGTRTLALKQGRFVFGPSLDGQAILFHQDGHFHAFDAATGKSANLTAKIPTTFIDLDDDHNVQKPPSRFLGWSSDSQSALLSDDWDIWQVPVRGGKATNLTGNGKKEKIRYQSVLVMDPEEKGVDLSKPHYVTTYGEWTKQSGLSLLEPNKAGAKRLLLADAMVSAPMKAKRADVLLLQKQSATEPSELFTTNGQLTELAKVSDLNPQRQGLQLSPGSRLIDYVSEKGDKLQAALYLPAGYEEGKRYPTIVYIYERLSQMKNSFPAFAANGFSPGHYTSNGYAVLMPDIKYQLNDPGMSAVWCLTPAVKAAVATGVVDEQRLGLHGHSWGGYQTAFMVTQSKMFKAAIAGAPLTDLVSMYSSVYWNTGSANQPIFESSQGRFTGGYWEQPEAYVRNSPVYHASKVETPLLILHNDKDGAVDFTQGIEYFNTLRRLQKPVVMLQYKGENHGLVKPANRKDYTVRMREYFDYYLKSEKMPSWLEQGVPVLDMKKHLEQRADLIAPPAEPKAPTAAKTPMPAGEKSKEEKPEPAAASPQE